MNVCHKNYKNAFILCYKTTAKIHQFNIYSDCGILSKTANLNDYLAKITRYRQVPLIYKSTDHQNIGDTLTRAYISEYTFFYVHTQIILYRNIYHNGNGIIDCQDFSVYSIPNVNNPSESEKFLILYEPP